MTTTVDARTHCTRPWRLHTLAPDFELLDLWELPLAADPVHGETFERFLRCSEREEARPVVNAGRASACCLLRGVT